MALKKSNPLQGEIWLFDPDPVKGREIGKKIRPALIVSNNFINKGSSGLVIVVPITSRDRGIASHVRISPPEGGVKVASYAMSEQVRFISKYRLVKKLGKVKPNSILNDVNCWLTDLLFVEE